MGRRVLAVFFFCVCIPMRLPGQEPPSAGSTATLHINSRAVLVDVIVRDAHGKPVTGLNRDAFAVTEQGKPQTISFFEEHRRGVQAGKPVSIPRLPANVFTNFSPFPQPPAVTVLLLDSLNTRMENQSFVHAQALKFLKTAKPGSRMAIFTMDLGLHFIQGFNDDPAVLLAALNNKQNNEVQPSVMLKGQDEANAQQNVIAMMSEKAPGQGGGSVAPAAAISALRKFFNENDNSRMIDRDLLTLQNFQRLASFLNSFPGRKNVIWLSQAFPLVITGNFEPQLIGESDRTLDNPSFDPRLADEAARTLDMLAAARVVLYPVDAGGADAPSIFSGETQMAVSMHDPSSFMDNVNSSHFDEATQRNTNQATMKMIAHQTGGRAFVNSNGLSKIIGEVAEAGGDFYTISYTPSDTKMDGTYRRIDIKVKGGNYQLSYRRGYVARDGELPGSGQALRQNALRELQQKGPVDPLLPFMDLGMPQSQQILIEAKISPEPPGPPQPQDPKNAATRYSVDFALGVKDLELPARADGNHEGSIRLSMIAYDRYGGIVSRTDRLVQYQVQPDLWKVYEASGVQLHADIAVPKGNYWLRTGIFDQQSRRVGTMEVPLAAVQPAPPRSNAAH